MQVEGTVVMMVVATAGEGAGDAEQGLLIGEERRTSEAVQRAKVGSGSGCGGEGAGETAQCTARVRGRSGSGRGAGVRLTEGTTARRMGTEVGAGTREVGGCAVEEEEEQRWQGSKQVREGDGCGDEGAGVL